MLLAQSRPWYERHALALAAAMFAVGLAVGNIANSDLVGRQLTANAAPAAPTTINTQLAVGMHPAEVLRVLDGDTFEARVRVWPGLDITTKIRLRSIDAPELEGALRRRAQPGGSRARRAQDDAGRGRRRRFPCRSRQVWRAGAGGCRHPCHAGYRNAPCSPRAWRAPMAAATANPGATEPETSATRSGFSPRMDCAKTQPLAA